MENQVKLRVTVWQPYFAGCMLAFGEDDAQDLKLLSGDTELQKEVFTWPLQEDVWAGITDYDVRASLQEQFTTEFQPMRAPAERSMEKMDAFVAELQKAVKSGSSEWSVAESGAAEFSNTSLMINGLIALHNQLNWMLDMFRDLPGASVSVR